MWQHISSGWEVRRVVSPWWCRSWCLLTPLASYLPPIRSLARRIAWGASPRGSIALERCARARAWLAGRDYVTPDDIRAIAPDVLRHRVLPSYEATAEGWDGDRLVKALLDVVPLP